MSARKKQLSPALAKRDVALARGKVARLRDAALADVALVKRRKAQIAEAFFEIGEALVRLKPPAVWRALGRRSFAELCEKDLEVSATRAGLLLDIVTRIPRETAIKLGEDRASAVSEILHAMPAALMTRSGAALARGETIKLPGGPQIDPLHDAADQLHEVAKRLRQAKAPVARRGRTTSAEERAIAAAAQRALHAAGMRDAVVEALATKPGHPANGRITRFPLARLRDLARALAKLAPI